ncbi:MAG: transcriptional regulator [Chloroflexi bacterium]|nr:transcriptional regulator [Chloroflexota bacterium]
MPHDASDIEALALLDEPVRRALYDWVVGAGRAVSRDEAATGAGVSRALAAFHLDRLARAGLLDAEYRRLTGRTGPGAGRPAKLYRRGSREVAVALPARRYDVPAGLFAEAIKGAGGPIPPEPLRAAARGVGAEAGAAARTAAGPRPSRRRLRGALLNVLDERGYEPRETASGEIRLGNCPFHALVEDHRDLVCGMNLALAEGLLSGLGEDAAQARLDPQPGQCCVAIGRPPA